ncbi:MAG: DnaJ family domain-containing protein [Bacteroidota bacterium]
MSRYAPVFSPDALVEERIQEALRRGDFDNLPGAGRPLALDDDALVPPEVRIAYRILKNAGFVPPEVLERREIAELEDEIARLEDAAARQHALTKLALLRIRLGLRRSRAIARNPYYERKIVAKLAGG